VRSVLPFPLLLAGLVVVSVDAQAQDVKVTLMDGSTVSAPLDRLTDTEVVLHGKPQPYPRRGVIPGPKKVIPLTSVRTIERRSHGVRNGVLIGIAAGVATNLVLSKAVDSTEYEYTAGLGLLAGIGAGIGLGVGAVSDAEQRDGRLLYSAPPSRTIRISSIVTRERLGLGLALTW
jgi:hypothetical protein